jgi:hypothetical protein
MDQFHKYLSDINPELLEDIYKLNQRKKKIKLFFLTSIYIIGCFISALIFYIL